MPMPAASRPHCVGADPHGETSEVLFGKTYEVLETSDVSLETSDVSLETSEVFIVSWERGRPARPGDGGNIDPDPDFDFDPNGIPPANCRGGPAW